MFKKTALVAGIGLALSVTAHADYRWELGGDYTYGQISADVKANNGYRQSDDIDNNIGRLYGTWYMENVDTSKGPLSEAAFLDHASNITVFGKDGEVDLNSLNRNLSDKNGQSYGVDTRYVAEGPGWKLSGWLVDLAYEHKDPGDEQIDVGKIGIGKYITPNTTLVLNYNNISADHGGDADGGSIDLEHMFLMSKGGVKVRGSAGVLTLKERDDINTYDIGGTWYITNNFGIGADYMETGSNGYDIQGWKVNSEWFVTEAFAVNLAYSQLNPDDINFSDRLGSGKVELSNDSVTLGAKFRF
jgi:hypothetical protein